MTSACSVDETKLLCLSHNSNKVSISSCWRLSRILLKTKEIICRQAVSRTDLPAAAALRLRDVLGRRMHKWLVSWRRIRKRKLSALMPLVPFSSAKGGAHPGGGTIQQIPALHDKGHKINVDSARADMMFLSALMPLVPLSSAKGGAHPGGGGIQHIPALHQIAHSVSV